MLYYVYVIVIYDGMYVCTKYGKYIVLRRISNNHEIVANFISTGGEGASGVLWGFLKKAFW